MDKQKILNKIDRLGDLFSDMVNDPEIFDVNESKKEEASNLMADITEYLMWFPGALFYHSNKEKQKRNKIIIDFLWKTFESENILDELLSGGYSGLKGHMLIEFSDRVKMLKPTFISVNPESSEFSVYFEEAMKAWLYGLSNASLIICFSVIENLLKDMLCKIDISYVYELKDPNNPKGVTQVSYDRIIMSSLNEDIIIRKRKIYYLILGI